MRSLLEKPCALFFLLIILFLSSCGNKAAAPQAGSSAASGQGERVIVGFSQIGAESAWRLYNTKDMQEAARKAGIRLLFFKRRAEAGKPDQGDPHLHHVSG